MKKVVIAVAIVAVSLFAVSTFAGFNIPGAPSAVNDAVKSGGKMALGESCKDKIKKANCRFQPNSTTIVCDKGDFSSLLNDLAGIHKGAESTVANDVDLYFTAHGKDSKEASARKDVVYNAVSSKIGYWDRGTTYSTDGNKNALDIRVEVR